MSTRCCFSLRFPVFLFFRFLSFFSHDHLCYSNLQRQSTKHEKWTRRHAGPFVWRSENENESKQEVFSIKHIDFRFPRYAKLFQYRMYRKINDPIRVRWNPHLLQNIRCNRKQDWTLLRLKRPVTLQRHERTRNGSGTTGRKEPKSASRFLATRKTEMDPYGRIRKEG